MDKKRIETEIKDLSYGIRFHNEQGDFHRGVADKKLEMVKRLEAKLAEPEKPKPELRHGDYGYDGEGAMRLMLNHSSGTMRPCGCDTTDAPNEPAVVLGNIFDDLTALSKDVTEFRVKNIGGDEIKCSLYDDGALRIGSVSGNTYTYGVNVEDFPTFVLKLRQMAATAARKSGKQE